MGTCSTVEDLKMCAKDMKLHFSLSALALWQKSFSQTKSEIWQQLHYFTGRGWGKKRAGHPSLPTVAADDDEDDNGQLPLPPPILLLAVSILLFVDFLRYGRVDTGRTVLMYGVRTV